MFSSGVFLDDDILFFVYTSAHKKLLLLVDK